MDLLLLEVSVYLTHHLFPYQLRSSYPLPPLQHRFSAPLIKMLGAHCHSMGVLSRVRQCAMAVSHLPLFPQRETSCLLSFLGLLLIPPQRSYPKSKQKPTRAHPSVISVFVFLEETHVRPLLLPTLGLYPGQSFAWICFDCRSIPSSSATLGITFSRAGVLRGSCFFFLLCFSRSLCLVLGVYVCCPKVAVLNLGVLTSLTNLYLQKKKKITL